MCVHSPVESRGAVHPSLWLVSLVPPSLVGASYFPFDCACFASAESEHQSRAAVVERRKVLFVGGIASWERPLHPRRLLPLAGKELAVECSGAEYCCCGGLDQRPDECAVEGKVPDRHHHQEVRFADDADREEEADHRG